MLLKLKPPVGGQLASASEKSFSEPAEFETEAAPVPRSFAVYPSSQQPLLIRREDNECLPLPPNPSMDYVVSENALGMEMVSSPGLGWSSYVPWLLGALHPP